MAVGVKMAGDSSIQPLGYVIRQPGNRVFWPPYTSSYASQSRASRRNDAVTICQKEISTLVSRHSLQWDHSRRHKTCRERFCPDSRIRLCDFGNVASMTGPFFLRSMTERWCSPYRLRAGHIPTSRMEDMYALGSRPGAIYRMEAAS